MPRFFERDKSTERPLRPQLAGREKFTPPLQRGPSPFTSFRNFSLAGLPIFQRPDVGTEPAPVPQVSRGEAQRMAANNLALVDPGEFGQRFPVGTSLPADPNQEQFTGGFDDLRLPVFRAPGSAPTLTPFRDPIRSSATRLSPQQDFMGQLIGRLFGPGRHFPPDMSFEQFIQSLTDLPRRGIL